MLLLPASLFRAGTPSPWLPLALIWTPRSTAVAGRAHPQLQWPPNPMPSFGPLSPWQSCGLSGPRASPKYRPGPSLVPACSSPGVHAFSDLSQVMEEASPPPASPPRLTYPNLRPPLLSLCPVCCLPGLLTTCAVFLPYLCSASLIDELPYREIFLFLSLL